MGPDPPTLHDAYLRLRALIPGAWDTPHGPTPAEVWATTEAALRRLVARLEALEEDRACGCEICGHKPDPLP